MFREKFWGVSRCFREVLDVFRGIFEGVRGCLGRFWGCFRGGL